MRSLAAPLLMLLVVGCGSPDPHAQHAIPPEAHAHDAAPVAEVGSAEGAWARAVAGSDTTRVNSAAYFALDNPGDAPLRLVGVESGVAERTEIHETTMEDGVMRMRPVEVVEVPPGGAVALEPGGLHVMLLGVRRDLRAGETFPLILRFADGGERTLEVTVRPATL